MRQRLRIFVLLSLPLISGCAAMAEATKQEFKPFPSAGSRSDGSVTITYNYSTNIFKEPMRVDQALMLAQAEERCKAWGYVSAEAFGGLSRTCIEWREAGSCREYRVDVPYQCLADTLP